MIKRKAYIKQQEFLVFFLYKKNRKKDVLLGKRYWRRRYRTKRRICSRMTMSGKWIRIKMSIWLRGKKYLRKIRRNMHKLTQELFVYLKFNFDLFCKHKYIKLHKNFLN